MKNAVNADSIFTRSSSSEALALDLVRQILPGNGVLARWARLGRQVVRIGRIANVPDGDNGESGVKHGSRFYFCGGATERPGVPLSEDARGSMMIDQSLSNDFPGKSGADVNQAGLRAPHWRELYPFASHYLQTPTARNLPESVRQHYVDENPNAERAFLFVHGNPTWSFYWRNLILGLRDSSRCVAIDHVGCGLSDKPQSYSYTLDQHIANLGNLIQSLDLRRVTLVAHDWGGAIGLGALQEHRERFEGIVLMNTGAFPPPYIPWRIRACRIPWLGTIAIRGFNGFAGAAVTMATSRAGGLAPEVKAGLLAPYHDWETRIATDEFVKDIPVSSSQPTFKRLAAIEKNCQDLADIPVQLIWGMQDWCFRPDCLHRFQKMFPQARTCEIPLANHYVVEDAPELVLRTIKEFAETATV